MGIHPEHAIIIHLGSNGNGCLAAIPAMDFDYRWMRWLSQDILACADHCPSVKTVRIEIWKSSRSLPESWRWTLPRRNTAVGSLPFDVELHLSCLSAADSMSNAVEDLIHNQRRRIVFVGAAVHRREGICTWKSNGRLDPWDIRTQEGGRETW